MRILAFGDIHGCFTSLKTVWDAVQPSTEDQIIMLGDYVDRGPQSKQVIDFLIEKQNIHKIDFLQGNHELEMMLARDYTNEFETWMTHWDAQATMDSYGATTMEEIPDRHWHFLKTCKLYIELENYIFVHACVEPNLPIDQQNAYTLVHKKLTDQEMHISGKTVICGHTAQKNYKPLNLGHTICIDTDAGRGGWVTCLDVESGEYWQANEDQENRTDQLSKCS